MRSDESRDENFVAFFVAFLIFQATYRNDPYTIFSLLNV